MELAVWWVGRITKTLLDRNPIKRTAQHELRLSTRTDAQLLPRVPIHRLRRTSARASVPGKPETGHSPLAEIVREDRSDRDETRHRPLTISALKQPRCRTRWRTAGRYAAHKRATLAGEIWFAC
jgi:hypothetical protein